MHPKKGIVVLARNSEYNKGLVKSITQKYKPRFNVFDHKSEDNLGLKYTYISCRNISPD